MARKGSTKVRTGCITCKIRKIKCDEAKPHCQKCISTGRKCDGYPPPPTGQAAYSWADLLTIRNAAPVVTRRNPSSICTASAMEARALEFFRLQVAPVLSKHSSTHFWNTLVSQVGRREPAVRHALVSISSIYEGMGAADSSPLLAASRERFALTQYNMALNKLASAAADQNIVLLVCLLFICIEMMQGNKDTAIEHCRHGITICNSASSGLSGWAKQTLQPIFLRLSTFPYFFGVETGDFPELVGLVSDPFAIDTTAEEKTTAWNYLVSRTVRLVRSGYNYRQGSMQRLPMPDHVLEEQRRLHRSLVAWHHHYRTSRTACLLGPGELESHLFDEMQCVTGKIWVASCPGVNEMVFDEHTEDFEELIYLSGLVIDLRSKESGPRPKFIFEMGFMPFLYFIVVNCRRLDIRLEALRRIPLLANEQENLFRAKTMYFVGKRFIEIEHGMQLDSDWPEYAGASEAPMPPANMRIWSVNMTDEVEASKDESGKTTESRKVFFLIKPDDIVPGFSEWVKVGPLPGTANSTANTPRLALDSRTEQGSASQAGMNTALSGPLSNIKPAGGQEEPQRQPWD